MKEWYDNLSRRDQLLLWPLLLSLMMLLVYGMVWSPLATATERLASSNQRTLETVDWMRQAVVDVKARGGAARSGGERNISAQIDASLPSYGLVMKRFQPIGEQGAQVALADASLVKVIAWLSSLETEQGMRLVHVVIESAEKPGYVKVRRLRLERG